jgi:ubiquinone/menaquinone biosynthesis C-methylase UbiE
MTEGGETRGKVTVLDINKDMIEVGKQRARKKGIQGEQPRFHTTLL